jgi:alkanesulfonate monooxygenase SsuD/methylene tetrahydromethanopterin reductase-like flavin-dependent oxidoreductase (luciferase family)
MVEEMCAQAALAVDHGFAGVMVSEHHGGFPGYIPNPLQLVGWLLERMARGWAAPCPMLLPLRPTAVVAEEIAWLAARFPGRVGAGFAAGGLADDFEIVGTTMDGLTARFASALEQITRMLRGENEHPVARDPAVAALHAWPIPMISAAASVTAARRAARLGVGVIFDSMTTPDRCRVLTDAYRDSGGTGPCVLIRRAWLGDPPRARLERQLDVYRGYAAASAQSHWQGDQLVTADAAPAVADGLRNAMAAAGCDGVNLRVHVPGVEPEDARDQIRRLGTEVVPILAN